MADYEAINISSLSECDRLLPRPNPFSEKAIRALRITLGLLGLWQYGVEEAYRQQHVASSGSIQQWDEDNNLSLTTESDQGRSRHQMCVSCSIDISETPLCENKDISRSQRMKQMKVSAIIKSVLIHVLWFSYLLTILASMSYDLALYLKYQWGKQGELLHFVSSLTFVLQVFAIPLCCLISRLRMLSPPDLNMASLPTINCWTVFRRAKFLQSPTCKVLDCSKLALFLTWPVSCGLIRLSYDYWNRVTDVHNYGPYSASRLFNQELRHWTAMTGYIHYGTFCYLIYIMRSSLQWESSVVVHFVSDISVSENLDACNKRIGTVYNNFRVLRDLVGLWMAFTMAVATWGITAHVTWNYAIYSRCVFTPTGFKHVMFLNILVWTQKVMFFVVPYFAVGGLNLHYIWEDLRYNLTRIQRSEQRKNFWKPLLKYTKDICFSGLALKPTILFSVVGLFLGLEFSNTKQNVNFWGNVGNSTFRINWGNCSNAFS